MQTTHPVAHTIAVLLVAAVFAAACSESDGREGGAGSGGTASPTPSEMVVTGPPGTAVYRYANAGLVATMQLREGTGTLEIQNDTGRELPPPDFYILDARDGRRVKGDVRDPTSVPEGQTMTFDVSFSGLAIDDIGLVILLMGRDNYGAFVRQ